MTIDDGKSDVIVVGAGAAGLMAARELVRAGKRVLVLESSNRIGGRVLTVRDSTAGVPVELGAEFIHGDAPETTALLEEARLSTVRVLGEQYRSDDGELSRQPDMWKRMKRVFSHLDPERKRDRSFQEFLDRKPGGKKLRDERELVRGFVQGFNGADVSLASEKSLALQGDPTEGAADARRITNGYGALIDFLARDVLGLIRFNSVVRRLAWRDSGVRVIDETGLEHEASAVILTVPLPVLQDRSLTIEPEIPALVTTTNQLVMGQVTRVNVIVKETFWEKKTKAASFIHAPTRPFNVWWTQYPVSAPLITGWSGGPPAVAILDAGDVETAALSELARIFGRRRDAIESQVDAILFHDWRSEPNVRGAYSYAGVGGAYASRVLARPFGGVVFLAGEATDSKASGTVEGAIASGKRAARKVLELS